MGGSNGDGTDTAVMPETMNAPLPYTADEPEETELQHTRQVVSAADDLAGYW